MRRVDNKAEFLTRVEKTNTCWVWKGVFSNSGYGRVHHTRAHRLAWSLWRGSIPQGLCVLHKCDNRACVRPSHLFLGTNKDNTRDMMQKGRAGMAKLTNSQARFVKRSKLSARDLATRFGVHRVQIWAIRRGAAYAHVGGE